MRAHTLPLLFLWLATAPRPASANTTECATPVPPGAVFFGGTYWNASSARWEAIKGSVWMFDSGVGSSINTGSLVDKPIGYHASMEGWTGVVVGGGEDYSTIKILGDLPVPLTTCTCGMGDTVLVLADGLDQHPLDQDNFAASPWITLAPEDLALPGRGVVLDLYVELFPLSFVDVQILVRWMVGGDPSPWTSTGFAQVRLVPLARVPAHDALLQRAARGSFRRPVSAAPFSMSVTTPGTPRRHGDVPVGDEPDPPRRTRIGAAHQ